MLWGSVLVLRFHHASTCESLRWRAFGDMALDVTKLPGYQPRGDLSAIH
jgi:hypothetical protein